MRNAAWRWRRAQPQSGKWLLALAVVALAVLLTYWPDGLAQWRYQRDAIASGQVWRVLSGHFTHINSLHLWLNLLGFGLLVELLWGRLAWWQGAALLLWSCCGVSALLWWLQPQLLWYAGLSGALHGLWAGCALIAIWPLPRHAPALPLQRLAGLLGMLLLLLKLGLEALYGNDGADLIGAPVIYVAHGYGAASGALYLFLWQAWARWPQEK